MHEIIISFFPAQTIGHQSHLSSLLKLSTTGKMLPWAMHYSKPQWKFAYLVRRQGNSLFAWLLLPICTIVLPYINEGRALEWPDYCPFLFAKVNVFIAFAVHLDIAIDLAEFEYEDDIYEYKGIPTAELCFLEDEAEASGTGLAFFLAGACNFEVRCHGDP